MNKILIQWLVLGFLGSLSTLILLLFQKYTHKHWTVKWNYFLWLQALLLFLLPLSLIISPFLKTDKALPFVKSPPLQATLHFLTESSSPNSLESPDVNEKIPLHPDSLHNNNTFTQQDITEQKQLKIIGTLEILLFLCKTGFLFLLLKNIYQLLCYLRWKSKLNKPTQHGPMYSLLEKTKTRLGIRANIRLISDASIQTPMLIGFFRKTICLPQMEFSPSDLEIIFEHELTHYKRKDIYVKYLLFLGSFLHGLNPLYHKLSKQIAYYMELCCDQDVIQSTPISYKKEYGFMLLRFLEKQYTTNTFGIALSEQAKKMKERLSNMTKKQTMNLFSKITSAFCTLGFISLSIFTGCTITPAAEKPVKEGNSSLHTVQTPLENPFETDWKAIIETGTITLQDNDEIANLTLPKENPSTKIKLRLPFPENHEYRITCGWYGYSGHLGIDYQFWGNVISEKGSSLIGQPVTAAAGGTVIFADMRNAYGNCIVIQHDNMYSTLYSQLDEIHVTVGEAVEVGQQIGTQGDTGNTTGPHLHFELIYYGHRVNPSPYFEEEEA